MMKLRIAFLSFLLPLASGATTPSHFGEFYSQQIEARRAEAVAVEPRLERDTPAEQQLGKVKEVRALLKLYAAALPAGTYIWRAVGLPMELRMPAAGGAAPAFYNTHLIWAYSNGKRVAGFRPVDTNTGCDSGCAELVYHLRFDVSGKVSDIVEEKHHPLEKLGGAKLSPEDKQQLISIASTLPRALREVREPSELADQHETPHQTWTFLKPFTVKGAAYSSYRVYQSALQVSQFLHPEEAGEVAEASAAFASSILRTECSDVDASSKKLAQAMNDTKEQPAIRKVAFQLTPFFFNWSLACESGTSAEDRAQQLLKHNEFSGPLQKNYCTAKRAWVGSPAGKTLLQRLAKAKDSSAISACDAATEATLTYLAANQKVEAARAAELLQNAEDDPELVMAIGLKAQANGLPAVARQARAILQAQFPNRPALELAALPAPTHEEVQTHLQRSRSKLLHTLPHLREAMPKLPGKVKIGTQGSQAILFFAAWCPHCRNVLTQIQRTGLNAVLAQKLHFVEVFPRDFNGTGRQLCDSVGFNHETCARFQRIDESATAQTFYDRLALFTVPRLVILDPKQRIALGDFVLDFADGRSPLRDLQWILESLDKAKP